MTDAVKVAEYRRQMERGSPIGISGQAFKDLLVYITTLESDRDRLFELITRARCRTPHVIYPEEIAVVFGHAPQMKHESWCLMRTDPFDEREPKGPCNCSTPSGELKP